MVYDVINIRITDALRTIINSFLYIHEEGPYKGPSLNFQRKINNAEQTINIIINPEQLFIEAINMFKLRTGMMNQILKFIFNGKDVIPDIKISQTGITNNSTITVISLSDVQGA